MRRLDLDVPSRREVLAVDVDSKSAAWLGVECGADAHPFDELGRVGEIGEDRLRLRGDSLLDVYRFDRFRSSASASNRKRSIFCDHILRR